MLETPGSIDLVDSFGQQRQEERAASWDTVSDIKFLAGELGMKAVMSLITAISPDVGQMKDIDDTI